jgi:hypothetical protein
MEIEMTSASLLVPPPLSYAERFRSDALDEVISEIARSDGEHSRVVHCFGPLRYKRAAIVGRNTGL